MQQPQLSHRPNAQQRQEKIMAWTLTILLHILVLGGGAFWYFKQNHADTANIPSNSPTIPTAATIESDTPTAVVASSPASTISAPLQAEINPNTLSNSNQTVTTTTTSPTDNKLKTNLAKSNNSTSRQNNSTKNGTVLPIALGTPNPPDINSKTKAPDNFPVNASTITQTGSQTTQTARGTVTITTTNRTTTVAPEVTQALTDSDIPAKERQKLNQQSGKLSHNAKEADKLANDYENIHQATSELIETVKKNNQAKIDNNP